MRNTLSAMRKRISVFSFQQGAVAFFFTVMLVWIFAPGYLDMSTNSVFSKSIVHAAPLSTIHAPFFFLLWRAIYFFSPYSSLSMYFVMVFLFSYGASLFCWQLVKGFWQRLLLSALIIVIPSNLVLMTIIQKEFFMQGWMMCLIAFIVSIQRTQQFCLKQWLFGGSLIALFFILDARPDSFFAVFIFGVWLFLSLHETKLWRIRFVLINMVYALALLLVLFGIVSVLHRVCSIQRVYPSIQLAISDVGMVSVQTQNDFLYRYTPQNLQLGDVLAHRQSHLAYISGKYRENQYYFIDEFLWRGPELWKLEALLFDESRQGDSLRKDLFTTYRQSFANATRYIIERHNSLWWFMVTRSAYWVKQLGFEQPIMLNKDNSCFWIENQSLVPRQVNEKTPQWRMVNGYIQLFPEFPVYTLISYFFLSGGLLFWLGYLFVMKSIRNIYILNAFFVLLAGVIYILMRWPLLINPSYRYGQMVILTTVIGVVFFIRGIIPDETI